MTKPSWVTDLQALLHQEVSHFNRWMLFKLFIQGLKWMKTLLKTNITIRLFWNKRGLFRTLGKGCLFIINNVKSVKMIFYNSNLKILSLMKRIGEKGT